MNHLPSESLQRFCMAQPRASTSFTRRILLTAEFAAADQQTKSLNKHFKHWRASLLLLVLYLADNYTHEIAGLKQGTIENSPIHARTHTHTHSPSSQSCKANDGRRAVETALPTASNQQAQHHDEDRTDKSTAHPLSTVNYTHNCPSQITSSSCSLSKWSPSWDDPAIALAVVSNGSVVLWERSASVTVRGFSAIDLTVLLVDLCHKHVTTTTVQKLLVPWFN